MDNSNVPQSKPTILKFLPLVVLALALPLIVGLVMTRQDIRQRAQSPATYTEANLKDLTDNVTRLVEEQGVDDYGALPPEVTSALEKRKQAFYYFAKQNPSIALKNTLSDNIKRKVNPSLVEDDIAVQGMLYKENDRYYVMTNLEEKVYLYIVKGKSTVPEGAHIVASGVKVDDRMIIENPQEGIIPVGNFGEGH